MGGLLLFVGNGGVVWAEQRITSGVAALVVAGSAMWMVVLDWARPGGKPPTAGVVAGLVLGLAGLVVLVGPGSLAGGERVDLLGAGAVMVGSFAWALGSIYSRTAPQPPSTTQGVGMQMLVAGGLQLLLGLAVGERVAWGAVSLRSWLAVGYLIVFGSIIGYTAYLWLLQHTSAAKAGTYAYVNPIIAVFLGWALAGEEVSPRVFVAATIIVAAVALITVSRTAKPPELATGAAVPRDEERQRPTSASPSRSDARMER